MVKNYNLFKKIFARIICCLIIWLLCGRTQDIYATSKITPIKKMVREMEMFERATLSNDERGTIKLNKNNKAKAAALSIDVDLEDGVAVGEFGGYTTFKITNKQIQKASQNLFGTVINKRNLLTQSSSNGTYDAYRQKDGTPVVYRTDAETEIDYQTIKTAINKKQKGKYQVVKKVYYGYWGWNKGQANYKIIYEVKKNKNSSFGYVIKKMKIKEIIG